MKARPCPFFTGVAHSVAPIAYLPSLIHSVDCLRYYAEGGKGTTDLAEAVVTACEEEDSDFKFLYDLEESIEDKINVRDRLGGYVIGWGGYVIGRGSYAIGWGGYVIGRQLPPQPMRGASAQRLAKYTRAPKGSRYTHAHEYLPHT